MKLRGVSPNSYIHVYVSDLYTVFPLSVCLFCCRKIGGPIVGILYINRSQKHECKNGD
jgi:hypothetical protein